MERMWLLMRTEWNGRLLCRMERERDSTMFSVQCHRTSSDGESKSACGPVTDGRIVIPCRIARRTGMCGSRRRTSSEIFERVLM